MGAVLTGRVEFGVPERIRIEDEHLHERRASITRPYGVVAALVPVPKGRVIQVVLDVATRRLPAIGAGSGTKGVKGSDAASLDVVVPQGSVERGAAHHDGLIDVVVTFSDPLGLALVVHVVSEEEDEARTAALELVAHRLLSPATRPLVAEKGDMDLPLAKAAPGDHQDQEDRAQGRERAAQVVETYRHLYPRPAWRGAQRPRRRIGPRICGIIDALSTGG